VPELAGDRALGFLPAPVNLQQHDERFGQANHATAST